MYGRDASKTDDWIASADAEAQDRVLAEYDCVATQAHVLMLRKQGIMSPADSNIALAALLDVQAICAAGEFRYEPGYGAQLTLEKMVCGRVGPDIGYQVHTGRSRNDQVLTAQKLAVRTHLLDCFDSLVELIHVLVLRAHVDSEV